MYLIPFSINPRDTICNSNLGGQYLRSKDYDLAITFNAT